MDIQQDFQGGLWTGDQNSPGNLKKPFWVKLTAYDGVKAYSWTEQQLSSISGVFSNLPGGRFGTALANPAFDPNGSVIKTPDFVQLQRAYFDTSLNWVYLITSNGLGGSGAGVQLRVPTAGLANQLTAALLETATDGTPPIWADVAPPVNIWAWDLNGGIVNPGRYNGLFLLTHSDNKPVFSVASGFTGVRMLCEPDEAFHTYTIARGMIISVV